MSKRTPATGMAVVTGAAGHLGGNLVRALLAQGQIVRAVDLGWKQSLDGLDLDWCPADLRDPASIRSALAGADVVYHLAAVISISGDPEGQVWSTNVSGVATVAQAALEGGVRRLVHCSSVHAFDIEICGGALDEASPRSVREKLPVYDRSKAAGEAELHAWVEKGLDAVVVNPTGLIGPYDFEPSRMGRFFLELRRGKLWAVVDGGFDWVDVRDVAAALMAAASQGRSGESYLLGGHRLSMRELAGMAAGRCNTGHCPKWSLIARRPRRRRPRSFVFDGPVELSRRERVGSRRPRWTDLRPCTACRRPGAGRPARP
ncbi:MAG TPA: NAD-dependent epimerase/dehydratase family protein [Candidatus Dormibacteraeota bacterium]|nr:NAD-dependent epimerase/dehydratase family protein [Candidatus Dormibacteraeota bacterium]